MSPLTDDAFEPVLHLTYDATESVPPPNGEAVEDAKAEPFGEGHAELSSLPLYPYHIVSHIWGKRCSISWIHSF